MFESVTLFVELFLLFAHANVRIRKQFAIEIFCPWSSGSTNIPLSKVRQEHSAIKDSGELLNTVLAVGVAGHFPPDSCNAMLLLLYKLTLPFYNLRVFFFL